MCLVMTGLVACNNAGETKSVTPGDSATTAPADHTSTADTAVRNDTALVPAASLQDDSVFADGSIPTSWENAGFSDPVAFKQFLQQLQQWVASDRKDSVADALDYPLRNPKIKDQQQFLGQYDTYFNERVKKALREQNLRQVFRNARGAMIGNGELWFTQEGNRFKITAINYK